MPTGTLPLDTPLNLFSTPLKASPWNSQSYGPPSPSHSPGLPNALKLPCLTKFDPWWPLPGGTLEPIDSDTLTPPGSHSALRPPLQKPFLTSHPLSRSDRSNVETVNYLKLVVCDRHFCVSFKILKYPMVFLCVCWGVWGCLSAVWESICVCTRACVYRHRSLSPPSADPARLSRLCCDLNSS